MGPAGCLQISVCTTAVYKTDFILQPCTNSLIWTPRIPVVGVSTNGAHQCVGGPHTCVPAHMWPPRAFQRCRWRCGFSTAPRREALQPILRTLLLYFHPRVKQLPVRQKESSHRRTQNRTATIQEHVVHQLGFRHLSLCARQFQDCKISPGKILCLAATSVPTTEAQTQPEEAPQFGPKIVLTAARSRFAKNNVLSSESFNFVFCFDNFNFKFGTLDNGRRQMFPF